MAKLLYAFLMLACLQTALVIGGGSDVNACVALGHPSVKIKLDGPSSGTAIIAEYDCQMMVQKTFCIAAIRLANVPVAKNVKLAALRFINLDDYSTLQGFNTASNSVTSQAFAKMMGGNWYGYAGLYNATVNKHGGTAMEVKFTFTSGTDTKTLAAAFDHAHVGIGEGVPTGAIAPRGHHIEVIEIRGSQLVASA